MIYLQALGMIAAGMLVMFAAYGVAVVVQDYYFWRRADWVLSGWHRRLTK